MTMMMMMRHWFWHNMNAALLTVALPRNFRRHCANPAGHQNQAAMRYVTLLLQSGTHTDLKVAVVASKLQGGRRCPPKPADPRKGEGTQRTCYDTGPPLTAKIGASGKKAQKPTVTWRERGASISQLASKQAGTPNMRTATTAPCLSHLEENGNTSDEALLLGWGKRSPRHNK